MSDSADKTGLDTLIASLAQNAMPVRRAVKPGALLMRWLLGSALYIAASLALMGFRPDLIVKLQSTLFLAEITLLLCITLTSAASAVTLSYPDLRQKSALAWAFTFPLALFALFLLYALSEHNDAPLPAHGVECFLCISLLTLLPAAWMIQSQRRLASTHYYLAGGAAVLASSSLGCLILRLSERTDSFRHLVVWHYLPMIGLGMAGLWLGKKILKW